MYRNNTRQVTNITIAPISFMTSLSFVKGGQNDDLLPESDHLR